MITEKIKRLLISPKETWKEIAKEEITIKALFYKYALFLALIPSVSLFIGFGIVGLKVGPGNWYRMPIYTAFFAAVFSYLLNAGGVFANGYIINLLGHYFHSESDLKTAMKLAVYSATAFWLAGIFTIIPSLGFLGILGLYSVYLLYTGLPILMKTPQDKLMPLTISIIVTSMILAFILNGVLAHFIYSPIYSELLTY